MADRFDPVVEVEPVFDIMVTVNGAVTIVMPARHDDEPERASLYFSVSLGQAILWRGEALAIRLTDIPPAAQAALRHVERVAVVEMGDDAPRHLYTVESHIGD